MGGRTGAMDPMAQGHPTRTVGVWHCDAAAAPDAADAAGRIPRFLSRSDPGNVYGALTRASGSGHPLAGASLRLQGCDLHGERGMRFAYILIKVERGRVREVANQLIELEEVSEVHS